MEKDKYTKLVLGKNNIKIRYEDGIIYYLPDEDAAEFIKDQEHANK